MKIGTLILAAGASSRMGEAGPHKLLCAFGGVPLVRHVAANAVAGAGGPVIVVSGFRAEEIESALDGLSLFTVCNRAYADGMAGSLKMGLAHPKLEDADGVMIMLADMPKISPDDLRRLARIFMENEGRAVVRGAHGGRPGHPVLLPRSLFGAIEGLSGDDGARSVIQMSGLPVILVDIGPSAVEDVDTPDALLAAGGVLEEIAHG